MACNVFLWLMHHLSKNSFGKLEHKGYKCNDKEKVFFYFN